MATPEIVEDILEHFGTKGMRWGERRAQKRLDRTERRFDKTFASKGRTNQLKVELHNNIGPVVQSKVNQLNVSPKYSKAISSGRLKDANDPITKQYINDFNKIYLNEMNGYLKGYQSPSGKTVKAELNSQDFLGFSLKVQNVQGAKKIKHADEDELLIRVNYIKDKDGRIIDIEVVNDELTQSAIENVLSHHGVKGMKWGVRRAGDAVLEKGFAISTPGSRSRGAAAAKSARKVTVKDKGKRLKTSGGKGVPTHPDALRAHKLDRIVKKSGTKALSDDDLRAYANRLQLEQNVSRISSNNKTAGAKVSKLILARAGNKVIDEVLNASTNSVKKTIYRMIN